MIPVYKPYFTKKTLSYAHDAIDSEWVSSIGYYIKAAEDKLKELLDVKFVLLVNNGTSATHLVAKTMGDRVSKIFVPNSVYVAAWNSLLFDYPESFLNFIEPDLETWNFDLKKLDIEIDKYKNSFTLLDEQFIESGIGILVVHNVGNPIDVIELKKKYKNCKIIEDNCEGFLGKYSGKYTGTESIASSISFYGNKNITSGEGGAFITNNETHYENAKLYHGQGQSSKRFVHTIIGNNYRMTNVQAALLYGQLELLPEITEMKNENFEFYRKELSQIEEIRFQKVADNCLHSNWMFGIRLLNSPGFDVANKFFNLKGVDIRPMFYPASEHEYLNKTKNKTIKSTNSELLSKECFILPSFPSLTKQEKELVVETVKQFIQQYK